MSAPDLTNLRLPEFPLKEVIHGRYLGVRVVLLRDKLVTYVAVGLLLFLTSFSFAQEVHMGSQIICFPPSNLTLPNVLDLNSFCWDDAGQQTAENGSPLWLHKYFPYILLLLVVLMYIPALIWRFTAAPELSTFLSVIIKELDSCYRNAIPYAKDMAFYRVNPDKRLDKIQRCVKLEAHSITYPEVVRYLETKRGTRALFCKYLLCRVLNMVVLILVCTLLIYFISKVSLSDQFTCHLHTGVLVNRSVPVTCKLVVVEVFYIVSIFGLVVCGLLIFLVIYAALQIARQRIESRFVKPYRVLAAFSCTQSNFTCGCDDLNMYLLFLEENLCELNSFRYLQVYELVMEEQLRSGAASMPGAVGSSSTKTSTSVIESGSTSAGSTRMSDQMSELELEEDLFVLSPECLHDDLL
ncbi:hypothetical protein AMELA_G00257850 [Ameiurus melas]|uniref:Pannexin n=1 Tax=Ameiurus melas TaxID=219545 RepID=A0A7J5ZTV4_AMEME|nr:hypothetical protein AMELA_G00257850 [Ameiurus melas]